MPATTQPRPCRKPNATTPTPSAPAARPPQISGRRPTRCRMLPPSSALGRLPSAATDTSRPACSGVRPATSWKRCVVTNCRPAIANRVNTADSVPARNAGLRKIAKSSSGYGSCCWRRANAAPLMTANTSAAAPSAYEGGVAISDLIASTRPDSAANASTDDTRSHGREVSRCPSGASSSVATNATTTTGTLIRNTEPHQKCCSSQPPMIGPSAAPTMATDPQIAMAMLRSRSSWKLSPINANVAGIIAAAPIARNARAAISCVAVSANAAASEATPNTTRPIRNMRR